MERYPNMESDTRPEEKVFSPTMIDVRRNIRQETREDPETGTSRTVWVYDTLRYYSAQEYTGAMEQRQAREALRAQEAIAELSVLLAQSLPSGPEGGA